MRVGVPRLVRACVPTAPPPAQVERLFAEGLLPVLCTTTTLAMGINLPAHLVRAGPADGRPAPTRS